ncbi:MAG TPA: PAS domain-containing protein, partial [Pyrinomonadaceae bacterium]|nr:PAS domain-containing protein [Pyrinomonadaceae bacterium]
MRQAKGSRDGDYSVLQAIAENTSDSIFAKDLEGRYILVNTACANFLGKSKEEILGCRDADLYSEESARQFVADDREVLRAQTTMTFEGVARGPAGEQSYRVTKGVVRDERGLVVGVFGISHDMTERRRAEEERGRLFREAQEAVRVRDDFLTIASHELKTPLTPLSLRLANLERRLERGEHVDPALLRQARQHLLRLTTLINDLLDAS